MNLYQSFPRKVGKFHLVYSGRSSTRRDDFTYSRNKRKIVKFVNSGMRMKGRQNWFSHNIQLCKRFYS